MQKNWQFCIIPVHCQWISNVYDLIDTGYIATQFNFYSNVNGNTFTNKFAMSSGFRPMNLIPLISWISSPTWIRPDRKIEMCRKQSLLFKTFILWANEIVWFLIKQPETVDICFQFEYWKNFFFFLNLDSTV